LEYFGAEIRVGVEGFKLFGVGGLRLKQVRGLKNLTPLISASFTKQHRCGYADPAHLSSWSKCWISQARSIAHQATN